MKNLWVWDGGSWRVIATYNTSGEAREAARNSGEPYYNWTVATAGSQKDEHMRDHCTERDAPYS